MHIDGKAKVRLLRLFDGLFGACGEEEIETCGEAWQIDTEDPNKRFLYCFTHNLLRHVRSSPLFAVIQRVLAQRPGRFIDVGANLGLFSYLARQLGATPLLFEPEPCHHAFLARNRSVFGEVLPIALSDQGGAVDFYVADVQHSGANSLVMPSGGWEKSPYRASIRVQTQRFDAVMTEQEIAPADIGLVKVDVEGHEASVVRGMKVFFGHLQAAPVWCEVRGAQSNRGTNSYTEVLRFVRPFGFRPYQWKDGMLRPFAASLDTARIFEILLAHPEHHRGVAVVKPLSLADRASPGSVLSLIAVSRICSQANGKCPILNRYG